MSSFHISRADPVAFLSLLNTLLSTLLPLCNNGNYSIGGQICPSMVKDITEDNGTYELSPSNPLYQAEQKINDNNLNNAIAVILQLYYDYTHGQTTTDNQTYYCNQEFTTATWVNPNCAPDLIDPLDYECSIKVDPSCRPSTFVPGYYLCPKGDPKVVYTFNGTTINSGCQTYYNGGFVPFTELEKAAYTTIPTIGNANNAKPDPTNTFKAGVQIKGNIIIDSATLDNSSSPIITTNNNGSITISLIARQINVSMYIKTWWKNPCYSVDWSQGYPQCKAGWSDGPVWNMTPEIDVPWLTLKLEPYITTSNILDFSTDSVDAAVQAVKIPQEQIDGLCTAISAAVGSAAIVVDPTLPTDLYSACEGFFSQAILNPLIASNMKANAIKISNAVIGPLKEYGYMASQTLPQSLCPTDNKGTISQPILVPHSPSKGGPAFYHYGEFKYAPSKLDEIFLSSIENNQNNSCINLIFPSGIY